jgi:hypothetical protein
VCSDPARLVAVGSCFAVPCTAYIAVSGGKCCTYGSVRYEYVVEGEKSERVRRGYENFIQIDLRKTVCVKTSRIIRIAINDQRRSLNIRH